MNSDVLQNAIAPVTKDMSSDTFTPEQAAEYLGIAVSTLSIWRSTKRYPLPYIKIGRLVRYHRSDLHQFLISHTVPALS